MFLKGKTIEYSRIQKKMITKLMKIMKTKGQLLHDNCVTCPHVTSLKTTKLSKAIES
jgi:hypothetical protein